MAEADGAEPPRDRPPWLTRAHVWWVFLVGGAGLVVVYEVWPWGGKDFVYAGVGLVGAAAVLVGSRLHRPDRPGAWRALALSQLLWVGGDLAGALQNVLAPSDAFPSLADVFYLLGYLPLARSLFLLTRGRRPRRDVEGVLDSLTVAVGLYLLCWVLLAKPTLVQAADSWVAAGFGVSYPVLDVTIIAMVVALGTTPGGRTVSLRLIVLAIVLVIAADTAATALGLLAFEAATSIDFLWLASYVMVGAAALHPSMRTLSAPSAASRVTVGATRRVATGAAVLVAPATLAVQHAWGLRMDVWAVVLAAVVMFLLVVARMNVAIHQISTANRSRDATQRELEHQAAHDPLTGLPNRAATLQLLEGSLHRAQRSGAMIGLLFVDLDGFKAVNDTYGHSAGDEVLQTVAARMQQVIRGGDVVGRLGGDEFVVLLEPVVDEEAAVGVGGRLITEVSAPIMLRGGQDVTVGASVGVAISQDAETDPDALLVEADTAAYRAKHLGRGRTEVFDAGLRQEMQTRAELERGLRDALQGGQLELRYQPVVNLTTGNPLGYEAVLHWNRPGGGLLAVPDFRPVAEASDLIFDLDAWALRQAARQIAAWEASGFPGLRVSVRLSVRHAARPRVLTDVRAALEDSGVAADQLTVQLSDTGLVDQPAVLDHLRRLRAEGTTVSLDDFGIGHSSVRRLATLPFGAVKLDGSLIDHSSHASRGLLELMVAGIRNFGLLTVVKGVRSEADAELLLQVGCELAQGDHCGGLVDADAVLHRLQRDAVPR